MLPFLKDYHNYSIENDKFVNDEYGPCPMPLVNVFGKVLCVFIVFREIDLSICINIESREVYFGHGDDPQFIQVFENLYSRLNEFFIETVINNTEEEYVVVIKEFMRILNLIFELVENIPVGNSNTKRALFFN